MTLAGDQWLAAGYAISQDDWFQRWIKQNTNWVYTDESCQQYWQDFLKSGQYDYALATDNPNLQVFKAHGGKLIMWQGLADQLIFTGGSINYYQAPAANGGIQNTESFFRYFLAPGVARQPIPAQRPPLTAGTQAFRGVLPWRAVGRRQSAAPVRIRSLPQGDVMPGRLGCPAGTAVS